MTTKFVTVSIEDRPGQLGRIARCLAEGNVNIEAFDTGPGRVTLLTNDPDRTATCLREDGFQPEAVEAFEIQLSNRPGQLASVGEVLGKSGVNIETAFGSARDGRIYLRVDKPAIARPLLAPYGPTTVEAGSGRSGGKTTPRAS